MKVSVIIPVHDRQRLIGRTLESILGQTYRPIELILVDNGSSDGSLAACQAFRQRHDSESFRVIVLEERKKGANAARNTGLAAATGAYVSFYDSDDEMLPDRLTDTIADLRQSGADLVAFPVTFSDERGETSRKHVRPETSVANQLLTNSLATQNFVARTELIRRIGGWDETLFRWQDWELGLRIMAASPRIRWITGRTFDIVHVHSQSITGTSFSASYRYLADTLRTVRTWLERSPLPDRPRLLEALLYRQLHLSALLKKEKATELSKLCRAEAASIPCRPLTRAAFRMLAAYTAKGGRGAWKIALLLLKA